MPPSLTFQEYFKLQKLPNTPLPGFTSDVPGWVPYALWCQPRAYENEDEGWVSVPSQRIAKRRAKMARRRREQTRWLGSVVPASGIAAVIPALQA